jgi:hypothetical protein
MEQFQTIEYCQITSASAQCQYPAHLQTGVVETLFQRLEEGWRSSFLGGGRTPELVDEQVQRTLVPAPCRPAAKMRKE